MSTTTEKTEVIRARVAPELKRKVAKAVKTLRSTESDVVRSAVVQFLDRQEKQAASSFKNHAPMIKPKRSLTVEQASVLIGKCLNGVPIPRRTMTTFIARGLPHMKLGKRLWFEAKEVLAWVKKHKRGERIRS